MSFSRLLRSATQLTLLLAVLLAAWMGFQHLAADGLSTIEASIVGLSAFIAATLVAFARA